MHCDYSANHECENVEDKSLAVLYSNLPNNLCTTIRANTEEFAKHMNRSVQEYGQACVNVMNVNAALADRYSGRWAEWCESVVLDKMLETLGRIQAQAFALYPDEKEKQDEVQCAH